MSIKPQGFSANVSPGRKFALLVGVNGESPVPGQEPLLHAIHDAQEMARVLQEGYCNFQLFSSPLVGEHATTENVRNAIFDLVDAVQDGDFVIFYFSGHTMPADNGDVYLVTHDFKPHRQGRAGQYQISFKFLREELYESSKAACIVFILDCCYAGMFSDSAQDTYLVDLKEKLHKYFQEPGSNSPSRQGGERLVLAATGRTTAQEHEGHGLMTLHMLRALQGEVPQTSDEQGHITNHLLSDYLVTALQPGQKPQFLGSNSRVILATHPDLPFRVRQSGQHRRPRWLRERPSQPHDFREGRLEGFVGREKELAAVRQMIVELIPQGGYLVITSDAGQGKSSLIAKLVQLFAQEQGGLDKVAYHFIRSDLRSGEQIYLLRNLLNLLIVKYDLPFDLPESGPALNDVFHLVLEAIVERKGLEVIFIDGLDQLAIDRDIRQHDLSFLPQELTKLPGIVFVLGTRRDETLRLLRYMKPLREYTLHGLSRDDFNLLLADRKLVLDPLKANRFYEKFEGHTLCLSLLASELALTSQPNAIADKDVEEILTSIGSDPRLIFSLNMDRLRLNNEVWERVSKPLLGLLQVAEEALTSSQIRQLLKRASSEPIDSEWLRLGLEHLGGLVVPGDQQRYIQQGDVQQRYTLNHLMFRSYLKNTYFSSEDQREKHACFSEWSGEESPALFWEYTYDEAKQEQRLYARRYYITHLYYARLWDTLFEVLDTGEYGKAKMLADPSGRSYARDLSWGQKAAASFPVPEPSAILHLPQLWHYTFLRCSLASRADNYPEATFRLLLLIGQEQERKASELAEMLTSPEKKARIFALITSYLATLPERQREAFLLALTIEDQMVKNLPNDADKVDLLRNLGDTLQRIGHAQEAEQMREKASQISRAAGLDEKGTRSVSRDFISTWLAGRTRFTDVPEGSPSKGEVYFEISLDVREEAAKVRPESIHGPIDHARNDGKAEALIASSLMLRQVEYWDGTEPIWQEVGRLIRSLPDTGRKARALAEFALSVERMGRPRVAGQIRWEVIEIISAAGYEVQQNMTLTQLVQTLESENMIHTHQDRAEDLVTRAMEMGKAGRQREAVRVLLSLENKWQQIQALADLGTLSAQGGHRKQTRQTWQEVERLIHEIAEEERIQKEGQDHEQPIDRLIVSALHLWQEGWQLEARRQFTKIEQVIERISDETRKKEAWLLFAEAHTRAGNWAEVKRLKEKFSSGGDRIHLLARYGLLLRRAELRGEAESLKEEFSPGRDRAHFLALYGLLLRRAGYPREAEIIIDSIEDGVTTVAISSDTLDDGEPFFLQVTKDQAIQAIKDQTWAKLAEEYWQEELWVDAEHAISQINDEQMKYELMIYYAEEALQKVLWPKVKHIFYNSNIAMKGEFFTRIGEIMAQMGLRIEAREICEEVKAMISEDESREADLFSQDDKENKIKLFARLGMVFEHIGERQKAEDILQEVEKDILSLFHEINKDLALAKLANALAVAGRWQKAREVIDAIVDQAIKEEALSDLGHLFALAKLWQDAKEVILLIKKDKTRRDNAFSDLANLLAKAKLWQEARDIASTIEDYELRVETVRTITGTKIEAREAGQADQEAEQVDQREARRMPREQTRERESLAIFSDRRLISAPSGPAIPRAPKEAELIHSLQRQWLDAKTREQALERFTPVCELIPRHPELGIHLWDAFKSVNGFLGALISINTNTS